MRCKKTLVFLFLAFAASAAQAAVLTTAPLTASELGSGESACQARNPGDSTLEVSIEGFNNQGQRVAALTFDLLPGSTRLILPAEGAGERARIASCQFSFAGPASRLEAQIIVRDPGDERELVSRLAK